MNPADRIALTERLARALHWNVLLDNEKAALIRTASGLLDEIETTERQVQRIGWMLVEIEPGQAEPVE